MSEDSEILARLYIDYIKDFPQLVVEFAVGYPMKLKTQSVDITLAVEGNWEVLLRPL